MKLRRRKQQSKEEKGIKRSELLSALDKIRPGLDELALISQSDHFIFMDNKISTYNNQLSISIPFPIQIKGSVHADEFYNLIKQADCDRLEITRKDKKLKVKGGKFKASFTFMEEAGEVETLIESLKLDDLEWNSLPSNFAEGLDLCSFSIAAHPKMGSLYGICIRGNSIYSTDNIRISWFQMDGEINESIIMTGLAIRELLHYNMKDYTVDDSWVHFKSDEGCIFSCQLIKEEFPDVSEFFGMESPIEIKLPDALIDVIKRVEILSIGDSEIDKEIDVRIEKDRIVCRSEKAGYGEIEEELTFKGVEESIILRLNPVFLLQVLDKTKLMLYSKGVDRVEFQSDNFRHIISLVIDE